MNPSENTHRDALLRQLLLEQFDTAWSLAAYHLEGLTTQECLREPAARCLRVHPQADGRWRADWPEHEGYDIGPPSIAWTTWHICFWWTQALARLDADTPVDHTQVFWPGSAETTRDAIESLRGRWRERLESAPDLHVRKSHSWPIPDSSFARIAAWLNIELMKNAAEIGVVRFLHGATKA